MAPGALQGDAMPVHFDSVFEPDDNDAFDNYIAPLAAPSTSPPELHAVLTELDSVWREYRSHAQHTSLIRTIVTGQLTSTDCLKWMACWIQQVQENSRWMRSGADSLDDRHAFLGALVLKYASEEEFDDDTLLKSYRLSGGAAESLDTLT